MPSLVEAAAIASSTVLPVTSTVSIPRSFFYADSQPRRVRDLFRAGAFAGAGFAVAAGLAAGGAEGLRGDLPLREAPFWLAPPSRPPKPPMVGTWNSRPQPVMKYCCTMLKHVETAQYSARPDA